LCDYSIEVTKYRDDASKIANVFHHASYHKDYWEVSLCFHAFKTLDENFGIITHRKERFLW
jgi:hypothetical protein